MVKKIIVVGSPNNMALKALFDSKEDLGTLTTLGTTFSNTQVEYTFADENNPKSMSDLSLTHVANFDSLSNASTKSAVAACIFFSDETTTDSDFTNLLSTIDENVPVVKMDMRKVLGYEQKYDMKCDLYLSHCTNKREKIEGTTYEGIECKAEAMSLVRRAVKNFAYSVTATTPSSTPAINGIALEVANAVEGTVTSRFEKLKSCFFEFIESLKTIFSKNNVPHPEKGGVFTPRHDSVNENKEQENKVEDKVLAGV